MARSKLRYFFGHSYKISMVTGVLILETLLLRSLVPGVDLSTADSFLLWFLLAILAGVPLGALLGALFIGPFLFFAVSRINGAPFQNGDMVRILVGPYRDRVACVYDVWKTRNEVRVDLGDNEYEAVKDVFGWDQVCREKSTDSQAG